MAKIKNKKNLNLIILVEKNKRAFVAFCERI